MIGGFSKDQVEQMVVKLVVEAREYKRDLSSIVTATNKAIKDMGYNYKVTQKSHAGFQKQAISALKEQERIQSRAAMKTRRALLDASRGLLIAGRMITKVFSSIRSASFDAFNRFTANTELANNATNRLNMGLDYLKYTVGSALNTALESIAPTLFNIIEGFSNWVEQNEELTGKLIFWGGIIGGIAELLGTIGYAWIGIGGVLTLIKGLGISTMLAKWSKELLGIPIAGEDVLSFFSLLADAAIIYISFKVAKESLKKLFASDESSSYLSVILSSAASIIATALIGSKIAKWVPALSSATSIGTILVAIGVSFKVAEFGFEKVNVAKTWGGKLKGYLTEFVSAVAAAALFGFTTGGPVGAVTFGALGAVVIGADILLDILGFSLRDKSTDNPFKDKSIKESFQEGNFVKDAWNFTTWFVKGMGTEQKQFKKEIEEPMKEIKETTKDLKETATVSYDEWVIMRDQFRKEHLKQSENYEEVIDLFTTQVTDVNKDIVKNVADSNDAIKQNYDSISEQYKNTNDLAEQSIKNAEKTRDNFEILGNEETRHMLEDMRSNFYNANEALDSFWRTVKSAESRAKSSYRLSSMSIFTR